jgi:acylphosphatase
MRISGRVQGVGFRWFTERLASELGIVGHVQNLPNGSVEVFAQGDKARLRELYRRLSEGPRAARVDNIECAAAPPRDDILDFHVRF